MKIIDAILQRNLKLAADPYSATRFIDLSL